MQLQWNCTEEYATGKTQENWSKLPICLYVVEDNGLSCGPFVWLEGVGFVSYLMKSTCHLSASKKQQNKLSSFGCNWLEILHHFWVDGISLHPLNLNIGGIQIAGKQTLYVMNGWNPCTTLDCHPNIEIMVWLQGEASRCWFCLVPHAEYMALVCVQKATKQVEFIRYSDRLVALYPQSPH